MQIEGWISLYQYDDEIRIQPTLYGTKEDALKGLHSTLGNYRTNHLKFVCEPIFIEQEAAQDGNKLPCLSD